MRIIKLRPGQQVEILYVNPKPGHTYSQSIIARNDSDDQHKFELDMCLARVKVYKTSKSNEVRGDSK
jgi:hypothetical protein